MCGTLSKAASVCLPLSSDSRKSAEVMSYVYADLFFSESVFVFIQVCNNLDCY